MQKRTLQRCIISRKQERKVGDISGVTSRTKKQITALLVVFRDSEDSVNCVPNEKPDYGSSESVS